MIDLISEEEFDNLPEDDEQCFIEFEGICRRQMDRLIKGSNNSSFDVSVRNRYMSQVSGAAQECGIDLPPSRQSTDYEQNFDNFSEFAEATAGEVARIRVRNRRARSTFSVQLTDNTRTKILHYVSRLREVIDTSSLPAAQRARLYERLNEFMEELDKRRLNLGKAMVILSVVIASLGSATTIAAEGPLAVTHIMSLIGADKQSEEAALSRLAPSPKALPSPPQSGPSWEAPKGGDLDDEIPF
jgi:hypothetical protein